MGVSVGTFRNGAVELGTTSLEQKASRESEGNNMPLEMLITKRHDIKSQKPVGWGFRNEGKMFKIKNFSETISMKQTTYFLNYIPIF